eukprot:TRINITY_DN16087_c0_g1_i1.p1 TRINITY_DN16087_c0_g1~~TRINITY_DN16087_c0_g1_i1.p1  ORF type:complete len:1869 (+),score=498.50 TRINITY_DN16087_c0_g1_i1:86-5692(+)
MAPPTAAPALPLQWSPLLHSCSAPYHRSALALVRSTRRGVRHLPDALLFGVLQYLCLFDPVDVLYTLATVLLMSVGKGDVSAVLRLLGCADDFWFQCPHWGRGRSLLHYAAEQTAFAAPEGAAVLRRLCSPVTVSTVDAAGDTPLHLACRAGLVPTARILLAAGADPQHHGGSGDRPADLAAARPEFAQPDAADVLTQLQAAPAPPPAAAAPRAASAFAPIAPRAGSGTAGGGAAAPDPDEEDTGCVTFSKARDESIGCIVDNMILTNVSIGSPAGKGNATKYIGWRLTHVNGVRVYDLTTAAEASREATEVTLHFRRCLHWRAVKEAREVHTGMRLRLTRLTRFGTEQTMLLAQRYLGQLGELVAMHPGSGMATIRLGRVDPADPTATLSWRLQDLDLCTNPDEAATVQPIEWDTVKDYAVPQIRTALLGLLNHPISDVRVGPHPHGGDRWVWVRQGDTSATAGKPVVPPPAVIVNPDGGVDPLWIRQQLSLESAENAATLWALLQMSVPSLRAAPSVQVPVALPQALPAHGAGGAGFMGNAGHHLQQTAPPPYRHTQPPLAVERRIDPADGVSYTKEEFVAYYKRTDEWDRAQSVAIAHAIAPLHVHPPGTVIGHPLGAAAGQLPHKGGPQAPVAYLPPMSLPISVPSHVPATASRGPQRGRRFWVRRAGEGQKVGWTMRNEDLHVVSVDPGSAADQAGLVKGMRLLSINGTPLSSVSAVRAALFKAGPEFEVTAEVVDMAANSQPPALPPSHHAGGMHAAQHGDGGAIRISKLVKGAAERMGTVFHDENNLVLQSVELGSAAFRCGLREMLGRRLTHVNGFPVHTAEDVRRFAEGQTQLALRWAPNGGGLPQPAPAPTPAARGPASAAEATNLLEAVLVHNRKHASDGGGTPAVLWVVTPNAEQACGGAYALQPGPGVHGMPLWKHTRRSRWISAAGSGEWHITDSPPDSVGCGPGMIRSTTAVAGRMPHQMDGWAAAARGQDPAITVHDGVGWIPRRVQVVTPTRVTHCAGEYHLVPREQGSASVKGIDFMVVHGMPIWKHVGRQRFLYSSARGSWYVTDDSEDFDRGRGFLFTKQVHGGALPHAVRMWQVKGQVDDPQIHVTALSAAESPQVQPRGGDAGAAVERRTQQQLPPHPLDASNGTSRAPAGSGPAKPQNGQVAEQIMTTAARPVCSPLVVSAQSKSLQPHGDFKVGAGLSIQMRCTVTLASGLRLPAGALGVILAPGQGRSFEVLACGARFDLQDDRMVPRPGEFWRGDVVVPAHERDDWLSGVVSGLYAQGQRLLLRVLSSDGELLWRAPEQLRRAHFALGERVRVKSEPGRVWRPATVRRVMPTGRPLCALEDDPGSPSGFRFIESCGPTQPPKDVQAFSVRDPVVQVRASARVIREGLEDVIGWTVRNNDMLVTAVQDGTPAMTAGIRQGMYIRRLNGAPIPSGIVSSMEEAGTDFQVDVEWPVDQPPAGLTEGFAIAQLLAAEEQGRATVRREALGRLQVYADLADTTIFWLQHQLAAGGEAVLEKADESERMGTVFRNEHTLVLREVAPDTAADRGGAARFQGQRLTHIGGRPVAHCTDVRAIGSGLRRMVLRFEGLPRCPAGCPATERPPPRSGHVTCCECYETVSPNETVWVCTRSGYVMCVSCSADVLAGPRPPPQAEDEPLPFADGPGAPSPPLDPGLLNPGAHPPNHEDRVTDFNPNRGGAPLTIAALSLQTRECMLHGHQREGFKVGQRVRMREHPTEAWASGTVRRISADGRPAVQADGWLVEYEPTFVEPYPASSTDAGQPTESPSMQESDETVGSADCKALAALLQAARSPSPPDAPPADDARERNLAEMLSVLGTATQGIEYEPDDPPSPPSPLGPQGDHE